MEREHDEESVTYEIPARTITGSVPQILDELDDMMDALQTVREAVLLCAPKPARPPAADGGWRTRVARLFRALHRARCDQLSAKR